MSCLSFNMLPKTRFSYAFIAFFGFIGLLSIDMSLQYTIDDLRRACMVQKSIQEMSLMFGVTRKSIAETILRDETLYTNITVFVVPLRRTLDRYSSLYEMSMKEHAQEEFDSDFESVPPYSVDGGRDWTTHDDLQLVHACLPATGAGPSSRLSMRELVVITNRTPREISTRIILLSDARILLPGTLIGVQNNEKRRMREEFDYDDWDRIYAEGRHQALVDIIMSIEKDRILRNIDVIPEIKVLIDQIYGTTQPRKSEDPKIV